jgi:UDP-N-acetylglucosamine transferase subunit ALG13
MITVTLGTIPIAFDRIISWLEILLEDGTISEPLFVQYGITDISPISTNPLVTAASTVEKSDLLARVLQSRFVISHAGQGSTRWLVSCNKNFTVVPRLARYHEHIDDHQLTFSKSVQPLGVHYCLSLEDLRFAMLNPPPLILSELLQGPKLADHLLQVYPPEAINR